MTDVPPGDPAPTAEAPDGHHRLDCPVVLRPAAVDARRPWRWTTATIVVATLFLALFNANAIGGWLDELPPAPLNLPLRAPVGWWATATRRAGLDAPRAWLRERWLAARAARFGHEEPGQQGAAAGD